MAEVSISTRTIIARCDWFVNDLQVFYDLINTNPAGGYGEILYVKYKECSKGDSGKKHSLKSFLNSMTLVVDIGEKKINVKVFTNGSRQLTGCKSMEQAIKTLEVLWTRLLAIEREYEVSLCTFYDKRKKYGTGILSTVMVDISYNFGYEFNLTAVNTLINNMPGYQTFYEAMLSNGVKITVHEGEIGPDEIMPWARFEPDGSVDSYEDVISSYVNNPLIPSNSKKSLLKAKNKNITFMVFSSGKVMVSGSTLNRMLIAVENLKKIFDENSIVRF